MNQYNLNLNQTLNFMSGQPIGPEHLNTLSSYPLELGSSINNIVLGAEGIITGYKEEFRIEVIESSLKIQVFSGGGILKNGNIIFLDHPLILDFASLTSEGITKYYIQLRNKESFDHKIEDEELNLTFYRYRKMNVEVFASTSLKEYALHIGTVLINKNVKVLKTYSTTDQFLSNEEKGHIDQRFVKKFISFPRLNVSLDDYLYCSKVIKSFRTIIGQLKTYYKVKRFSDDLYHHLFLLELEISGEIFHQKKINIILREIKSLFFQMIEAVRKVFPKGNDLKDDYWNELLLKIKQMNSNFLKASVTEFYKIEEVCQMVGNHLVILTEDEEKRIIIKEHLDDIRIYNFSMQQRHSFGGYLFHKKYEINSKEMTNLQKVDCLHKTLKFFHSQYDSGEEFSGYGFFISTGKIYFTLKNLRVNRDLIIFTKIFKRRGNQTFFYSINGNNIYQEEMKGNQYVNRIVNVSELISGKYILDGDNTFCLNIKRTDLDFGLLEVVAYQAD